MNKTEGPSWPLHQLDSCGEWCCCSTGNVITSLNRPNIGREVIEAHEVSNSTNTSRGAVPRHRVGFGGYCSSVCCRERCGCSGSPRMVCETSQIVASVGNLEDYTV